MAMHRQSQEVRGAERMGARRSVCVCACVGAQAPMGLCARVCVHASAIVSWQQGAWCWGWLGCHGVPRRGVLNRGRAC